MPSDPINPMGGWHAGQVAGGGARRRSVARLGGALCALRCTRFAVLPFPADADAGSPILILTHANPSSSSPHNTNTVLALACVAMSHAAEEEKLGTVIGIDLGTTCESFFWGGCPESVFVCGWLGTEKNHAVMSTI